MFVFSMQFYQLAMFSWANHLAALVSGPHLEIECIELDNPYAQGSPALMTASSLKEKLKS